MNTIANKPAISFKGNYFFKGDNTTGIASLPRQLIQIKNSYVDQNKDGTLLLTNGDRKERETIFRAMKEVYKGSKDEQINKEINQAFAQRAVTINVNALRQWPRQ